jgi:hypothetical protein
MNDVVRQIEQYEPGSLRAEIVSKVMTARVMFADYELLRATFSELAPLCEDSINDWLVANVAFISQPQALQTTVNSKIKTRFEYTFAFRPPAYGRAAIFSLARNRRCQRLGHASEQWPYDGCLDVKGLGVAPSRKPLKTKHGNGLLLLARALREVIYEHMLRRVFSHAGSPILTARNYAIIDLGFKLKYPNRGAAGLLVRQAYLRDHEIKNAGSIEDQLELKIELLLRRYGFSFRLRGNWIDVFNTPSGLTTSYGTPARPMTPSQLDQLISITGPITQQLQIDGLNVQFTRELRIHPLSARLIDFAGVGIYESFDNPLATLVADRPLFLGHIVFPSDAKFVQPDPRIRVRIQEDDVNYQCMKIVQGFRHHWFSPDDVGEKIRMIVDKGTGHLAGKPSRMAVRSAHKSARKS